MNAATAKQRDHVGALVVTHGNLALELVSAAKKIVGQTRRLQAVCIKWDEDVSSARESIEEAMEKLRSAGGVLILTDMFGGTPTNISLSFLEPGQVEIVTGVNLPMLVKFLNISETAGLDEVVEQIAGKGQQSIQVASEILDRRAVRDRR